MEGGKSKSRLRTLREVELPPAKKEPPAKEEDLSARMLTNTLHTILDELEALNKKYMKLLKLLEKHKNGRE
jgi:hypothetical protein